MTLIALIQQWYWPSDPDMEERLIEMPIMGRLA